MTPHFGKIRLRAQGARKHGAKLQGHLEPGALTNISLVVGRGGLRLITARLRETFPGIRGSWPKLRALWAVLAVADANLLEERDGAPGVFAAATEALAAIEMARDTAALSRAVAWLNVRLIAALGLLPAADTPEAHGIPTLLTLAAGPAAPPADQAPVAAAAPELLTAELGRLASVLGSAARVVPLSAGAL